jgi:lipopolysaccharide export system protein LptA
MNKKNLSQLILVVLLFIIVYVFYLNFFKTTTKKSKVEITTENKDINTEINTNVIENLKYVSEDIFGNRYTIEAKSAEIIRDEEELIKLIDVEATIDSENQDIIYINSDFADYNRINNNTIFQDNIKIMYNNHLINSDIIKLNFQKNMIEILENVHYSSLDTEMYADKVEIDLIDKNLKLSMSNEIDEILIKSNY